MDDKRAHSHMPGEVKHDVLKNRPGPFAVESIVHLAGSRISMNTSFALAAADAVRLAVYDYAVLTRQACLDLALHSKTNPIRRDSNTWHWEDDPISQRARVRPPPKHFLLSCMPPAHNEHLYIK